MIRTVAELLESHKKRGLVKVDYHTTVKEIAGVLSYENINLVVVTKKGKPVGLISTSDISEEVTRGRNPSERCAFEIMTEEVVTVTIDEDIKKVSKTMTEKNIRHIVVTRKGKWTEILSIKEVLGAVTSNEQELEDQLELYKQSGWPPVS